MSEHADNSLQGPGGCHKCSDGEYAIRVEGVHKSFESNYVLRGIDLNVKPGETYAIIGRSGVGKSVLLKHIMGFMLPDEGHIYVCGEHVNTMDKSKLFELRFRVGMVFQLSALLNSLTVRDNVVLGLSERGRYSEEELDRIAAEKLELVSMGETQNLLPEELSGGMKKRVAVARTLATNPDLILFDEPTAGLDPIMSDNVDELILELREKVQCTNVVVTHDMISAFRVADTIGMFHEGRIVAEGSPDEIQASDNSIVRDFINRTVNWRSKQSHVR